MRNKIIIIKKNKGVTRKIGKTYQVTNLLTREQCKNLSVAVSKARNHSEITKNIKSERIYYILKGKLVLKRGNKKFVGEKGDIIFIPKNTEYQFQGTFEAILINSPAFRKENEVSNL